MARRRRTVSGAMVLACVGAVVLVLMVGLVVAWPVLSSGPHHAAGAAAEPEVPVPVGALGGLGVSSGLGVSFALGMRGRRRRSGDP
jgi:hypothetical protein